MKFSTSISILALTFCLVLCGCGGGQSAQPDEKILRMGNGDEPKDLDPHTVTGVPEHHIIGTLLEGLTGLDPATLEPIPAVAESWEVSEDGLTYTFHLRSGAKWSNGDPVTSADFLYAWERILTPELGSEYANMLYPLKNAEAFNKGEIGDFAQVGAKAPDPHTVVLELDHPTPYLLTMQVHYTWFPVHKATIEQYGTMTERGTAWTRAGNFVGNGAFVLEEWNPDEYILVKRNPEYWDAANVALDGVQFFPVSNAFTEERMFREGELHVTNTVEPDTFDRYQREEPEVLRNDPFLGSYFYRVNTTHAPFDDPRVRLALGLAVDRDDLVRTVVRTGRTPAYFYTPPNTGGYTCEARQAYDPERARELLSEAGYPNGEGFPKVDILYNTSELHKPIAEALQSMWKTELNIDAGLRNQEWKVYLDSTQRLDYDLARAGWIGDYVDPYNFLECFLTTNGNNRTGWSNAEYDELLARAVAEPDNAKRFEYFQRAEAILLESAPVIPLYFYTNPRLMDTAVQNFEGNILGYISYKSLDLEQPGADTAEE